MTQLLDAIYRTAIPSADCVSRRGRLRRPAASAQLGQFPALIPHSPLPPFWESASQVNTPEIVSSIRH